MEAFILCPTYVRKVARPERGVELLDYFLAQNLTNLPSVQNRGGGRKVQDRADLD